MRVRAWGFWQKEATERRKHRLGSQILRERLLAPALWDRVIKMSSLVASPTKPNPDAGELYRDTWPDRLLVSLVKTCSEWFLIIFFWLPLALLALKFCGIYNASALIQNLHSSPRHMLAYFGFRFSEYGIIKVAWCLWLATIARRAGSVAFYRRRGLVVRSHTVGYSGDVLPTLPLHHRDERWCWRKQPEPFLF